MRNFVNEAIFGKPVGQEDFFGDLLLWWDALEPTYKYVIIGGAGLFVITILLILIRPAPKAEVKGLEELLRLKMLKELAE